MQRPPRYETFRWKDKKPVNPNITPLHDGAPLPCPAQCAAQKNIR
jgi:hypothetical protein